MAKSKSIKLYNYEIEYLIGLHENSISDLMTYGYSIIGPDNIEHHKNRIKTLLSLEGKPCPNECTSDPDSNSAYI